MPAGNLFLHIINFARGPYAHIIIYLLQKECVGVDKEQSTRTIIRRSVGRCLTKMNVYAAAMESAREQDRGEWNAL